MANQADTVRRHYRSRPSRLNDSEESTGNPRYVEVLPRTGWQSMSKIVREIDEDKVRDCKEDIDTLLVFLGLYSAVLSAFLIESYKSLQPDPDVMKMYFLERIALQTEGYSLTSGSIRSTAQLPPRPDQGAVPLWALRVNGLWFASLIISLATASMSMLVKQWLREYLAVQGTSPQMRLRARQYRKPGLEKWKVFEIAAILPMLLQLSLGMFFIGLCFFTASINDSMGLTSVPLVSGWALFVVATTLSPLVSPRCPYKTPLLKAVFRVIRPRFTCQLRPWLGRVYSAIVYDIYHSFFEVQRKTHSSTKSNKDEVNDTLASIASLEEDEFITRDQDDTKILLDTDSTMADDNLLPTIWETFQQRNYDPAASLSFILELMRTRVDSKTHSFLLDKQWARIPDLKSLPRHTWVIFMEMLADLADLRHLGNQLDSCPVWLQKTILLLLSDSPHPLPRAALECFRGLQLHTQGVTAAQTVARWIDSDLKNRLELVYHRLQQVYEPNSHIDLLRALWNILKTQKQSYDPATTLDSLVKVVIRRLGPAAHYLRDQVLVRVPDLSNLSAADYNIFIEMLTDLASGSEPERPVLDLTSPNWLKKTVLLLLSISPHPFPKYGAPGVRRLIIDAPGLSSLKALIQWMTNWPSKPAMLDIQTLLQQMRIVYEALGDRHDRDTLPLIAAVSGPVLDQENELLSSWKRTLPPRIPRSFKTLSFVVDYLVSRLGPENNYLSDLVELHHIPDLTPLSHRAQEAVADILAEGVIGHGDACNYDLHLQKTVLLLLSTHPGSRLPASAASGLRDLLFSARGRKQAQSVAEWLIPAQNTTPQQLFGFRPLSYHLRSAFESGNDSPVSLYTVYAIYTQLLRPHCSTFNCEDSLYTILIREPTLFGLPETQPIVADSWDAICSVLTSQKTAKVAITGSLEGLSIVVEFAERMGKRADAARVLSALWCNWSYSYVTLLYASASLYPMTTARRAYTLDLGIAAFATSEDQAKLLERSVDVATHYAVGQYKGFIPMDMVRFSFLHVKLYEDHLRRERHAANSADHTGADRLDGTAYGHPKPNVVWARLWYATISALRAYLSREGWKDVYKGAYWYPTPTEETDLEMESRKVAGECLETMHSLEVQYSLDHETAFPNALFAAVGDFVEPQRLRQISNARIASKARRARQLTPANVEVSNDANRGAASSEPVSQARNIDGSGQVQVSSVGDSEEERIEGNAEQVDDSVPGADVEATDLESQSTSRECSPRISSVSIEDARPAP